MKKVGFCFRVECERVGLKFGQIRNVWLVNSLLITNPYIIYKK